MSPLGSTNHISLFCSIKKTTTKKLESTPCWEVNGISNKALRKPFNGSAGFNAKPIQAFIQELLNVAVCTLIAHCTNTMCSCKWNWHKLSITAKKGPSNILVLRYNCKKKHCCLRVIQATCVGSLSFIRACCPMKVSVLCQRVTLNYANGNARCRERGKERKKEETDRRVKKDKKNRRLTVLY